MSKNGCFFMCCAVVALLLPRCLAEEVRQVIAMTAQRIELDGKLNEEVWKSSSVTEPFLYLGTHSPTKKQTRARVAYDKSSMYVAVECDENDLTAVRGGDRQRDADQVWQDDCVEILLAPALGSTEYYHFIFNIEGSKYDSCVGGKVLAAAWNPDPDWQVAVIEETNLWTAEIAVPLKSLGVETPLTGELWGLKICRSLWGRGANRNEDAFSAWSYSPSVSYHDPAGWGRLYFGSTNILANGDFRNAPYSTGIPNAWSQQLVWESGQTETGFVKQEELQGAPVMRVHKNPETKGSLLPRAMTTSLIRGGHRYRATASVMANGTVELIFSFRTATGSSYLPNPFKLKGESFEQFSAEVEVPPKVDALTLMFAFDRDTTGDFRVRDVSVRDLGPPTRKLDVDLIHNLKSAAATLVDMKPYDRVCDGDGSYPFERLIFKDTGTGSEIRRITWDWHGSNTIYSNMYPWNPNGSTFKFLCWERPGEGEFLTTPDGASLKPLGLAMASQSPRWGKDPDTLVYGTRDALMSFKWKTGEKKTLYQIPGEIMQGGRPYFTWDLDLPGLVYYEQAFGTKAPLYFVDLKTSQYTRIPITSDSTGDREKDWLYSAGLSKIGDTWYVGYSLNHLPHLSEANPYQQRLGAIEGKRGLNRLSLEKPEGKPAQPLYSHGGTAPDRNYECGYYGGGIWLWDFDKWEGKCLVPGPNDGHIAWMYQKDWFLAGNTGAPLSGPFNSLLMKVYTDGTWYPVAYGNTRNTEYGTCFFANLSPDGTKGSFSSTMLGPINMFWVVISYPEPPVAVTSRTAGKPVTISWSKPGKCAELAGYNVYRSAQSGIGYQRVNRELVRSESFTEALPDPSRPFYYVVTAVEHSGLESHFPSNDVVVGKPDAKMPERLFMEAERGVLQIPLRENFHGSASNLLFVDCRDGEGEGAATYTFVTRKAGAHTLWARVRYQGGGTPAQGWQVQLAGKSVGQIITGSREWKWKRIGGAVIVAPGKTTVALTASGSGFAVDKLLLTDDAEYEPKGEEKLDSQPPATPSNLKVNEVRPFDLSFGWDAAASDCDHYQVYRGASSDFTPSQETLVGSPGVPRFVEWGLTRGTQYYYRVSAVDSFGNESASTPVLAVKTIALEQVVNFEFEAESGQGSDSVPIIEEKDASGGKYLKMVPTEKGGKEVFPTLAFDFDVPVVGDYIVWLKMSPVSDRGYAYASARMDDGPSNMFLRSFGERSPTASYRDVNLWCPVGQHRQVLPVRFTLTPGKHRLTISSEPHNQDFGLDKVVITNDLGKRPAGRHLTWESG